MHAQAEADLPCLQGMSGRYARSRPKMVAAQGRYWVREELFA